MMNAKTTGIVKMAILLPSVTTPPLLLSINNLVVSTQQKQYGIFYNHDIPPKIWLINISFLPPCMPKLVANQSIDDFQAELYAIWYQLALSKPVWICLIDAKKFETYRDHQHVITLFMAQHDIFEQV